MEVTIRKAKEKDLAAVEKIYDGIHTEEEAGRACVGWERGIYPTRRTAEDALEPVSYTHLTLPTILLV